LKIKVWLIFFEQGPIALEKFFNRDHVRDENFSSKVWLIRLSILMSCLGEIPERVHVGCARDFYSLLVK